MFKLPTWFISILVGTGFAFFSPATIAFTECVVKPQSICAGSDILVNGGIWFVYSDPNNSANTASAYIGNANVNLKNIYSMITTALVTGRKYQIKFQANGVNCFDGGQHADWLGGWLL